MNRDYGGRFDFNLTSEEKSYYSNLHAKGELRRILTAEFDEHGRPRDVTPEQMQWALNVVKTRPTWALSTLAEMGFKHEKQTSDR
jgi:transposase